jgi:hypothetical protein
MRACLALTPATGIAPPNFSVSSHPALHTTLTHDPPPPSAKAPKPHRDRAISEILIQCCCSLQRKSSKMSISFPKTEDEILNYWREIDAFQTQLSLTEGQPAFTFYDGPPFGMFLATSLLLFVLECLLIICSF